jgi:hypothetical protein
MTRESEREIEKIENAITKRMNLNTSSQHSGEKKRWDLIEK